MKEQEAKNVLEIMSHADGGCTHCVSGLYDSFQESFPDFKDLVAEATVYVDKFDDIPESWKEK